MDSIDIIEYYTNALRYYRLKVPGPKIVDQQAESRFNDIVGSVFLSLAEAKERLGKVRAETMGHVGCRESKGRIELVAIDDVFRQLQGEIATLEARISKDEAVVKELARVYERNGITKLTIRELEWEKARLDGEIRRIGTKLNSDITPIRNAAATAGTDPATSPKIAELKALAAEEIKLREAEKVRLAGWIAAIKGALAADGQMMPNTATKKTSDGGVTS